MALFAELASDEVAQGGAVVPPVETPFLVAAVHSNSGRWSAVEDTVLQIARDLYIIVLQIDSQVYKICTDQLVRLYGCFRGDSGSVGETAPAGICQGLPITPEV